ncbi:LysR substrate-binding domain-containing protein [Herbaspirillum sp. RTI4]|uniref:LysR family transcriptional regulator n=1 Tax=Herbaspirillum sp. RTI4 TaxID=3048640 RepID=UPI002AB5353A|nr:LysR substrate-binding domain-containing protein [Herbaspirillum sp. RTI4]MDY7579928.1 LysR substrate-binding domain-containing protein [Herbaspirillum sp. RTI4]MEA9983321.1 LysR substrate-binding domain-containing protein [Herbaspirillum sp. RTI4]
MDVKQLRALLAIAETGSVTRAAELLHIVQPAVSRQLRLLEEDMGTMLFARGRRGMELTAAGHILAIHARRALQELDQAKAEIVPAPGAVSGSVTIGLLPSTGDLLAATLVTSLKKKYPQLTVNISIGYAGYLQQWLEDGDVDVALLYDPKPSAVLEVQALLDETLYLIGLPDCNLSAGEAIALHDIAELPLILPSQPHGLRLLLDHACAMANIHLSVVAETNAMNVQKNLVYSGLGFTILPGVAVSDDVAVGRLVAIPVTKPALQRKIVLALPLTRRASIAVRCAVTELRELIKDKIMQGAWSGATWLAD